MDIIEMDIMAALDKIRHGDDSEKVLEKTLKNLSKCRKSDTPNQYNVIRK